MAQFYAIALLVVIASITASSTDSNDCSDTCISISSPKLIEHALGNISNQVKHVGTRDPSDMGESLTGIASLLQLCLLRELLSEHKKDMCPFGVHS